MSAGNSSLLVSILSSIILTCFVSFHLVSKIRRKSAWIKKLFHITLSYFLSSPKFSGKQRIKKKLVGIQQLISCAGMILKKDEVDPMNPNFSKKFVFHLKILHKVKLDLTDSELTYYLSCTTSSTRQCNLSSWDNPHGWTI